ncbi:MAG: hypothetical protein U0R70_06365 [Solirubrobacteraceae bacterium]
MLDELRNRTAALAAAAAVTTAFFTSATISPGESVGWLVVLALSAFALVLAAGGFVILPRRASWMFTLDARVLLDDPLYSSLGRPELESQLARRLAKASSDHDDRIKGLYVGFTVAVIAFGVETSLWIAATIAA